MIRTATHTLSVITLLALFSGFCAGQVATGTPPFSSVGGGPFDTVNLGNLNVHFAVPIFHKAGRGLPFNYDMIYENSVWTPVGASGYQTWTPAANWGWTPSMFGTTGYISYTQSITYCYTGGYPSGSIVTLSNWMYIEPLGTRHAFTGQWVIYGGSCTGTSITSFNSSATDDSGMTLHTNNTSGSYVQTRDGTKLYPPLNPGGPPAATTITDANGNQITSDSSGNFSDTLSTTPTLTVTGSAPTITLSYASPAGSVSYKINYNTFNVKTNFTCSGTSQYSATGVYLITSITLPDDTAGHHDRYSFAYEDTPGFSGYTTGRLVSVTLPTGGVIAYAYNYSDGHNGIVCADGSNDAFTRTLTPGGVWTYSRTQVSGNHWRTTVTSPPDPTVGNDTVLDFAKDSASTNPTNNFYETQRVAYQGTAPTAPLATTITCYNAPSGTTPTPSTCAAATVSTPIVRTTAFNYLPSTTSGEESETDSTYDSGGLGLIREVDAYDYGNGVVGGVLRKTLTSYTALGNGIVDRPASVSVEDASNNVKASTSYLYDETTVSPTSGTPQHISITGSRGNVTTVIASTANGVSALYRHFAYYDTGMLNTSTGVSTSGPSGPTTTYNYASGTASCGNSFITSINEPLSLLRSMQWDCNGGVLTKTIDENTQPTIYAYDSMWRLNSVTYPDGGLTTTTYNIIGAGSNIQTSSKINATSYLTGTTVLDGLGRPTQQQLTSDPSGTPTTDTAYDTLGRVYSVSNPHRSGSSPTDGTTFYSYDALGRTTQIKRPDNNIVSISYTKRATKVQDEGNGTSLVTRISQADGLGRLTSTCEVSAATQLGISPTPAACGLDISGTGFLTSYVYDTLGNMTSVSQGGLNTRTYAYDMLSRLTSETNPELNGNTIYYAYDTCSAGDLCTRTAPKPNQTGSATVATTYTYDALHRLTGKNYNDGTTPAASFVYDNPVWGVSPLNAKGRLTLASTSSGCVGTIFSYDPMGRVANDWQVTPLTCGSFHLMFGYDLLGDLTSLYNGFENTSYVYSYDTAARLTTFQSTFVDTNHPGTLLTVNSSDYNPLGEIQKATLGNGIVRNLTYDNRGRLTSQTDGSIYNFSLSYAPDSNILTGNDSLNGNWVYGYDDFSRLATSNKNSGQQTFSYKYDRFGNRWQQNAPQGGPAPQYTFDANNHLTTSGVVYDAAGNVTNDTFHTYSYDAEGRVLTVDGGTTATYVYDATGKRVRGTVGGSSYDQIYDQAGRAITRLNSGSWAYSELYAAGMHVATYSGGTTNFEHSDWLGTVRARSNPAGSSIETCTSLPFGDALTCQGTDMSLIHFTGDLHDGESNLEHTLFRQYTTTQGRWTVPDPAGMAAVDPTNPQSWNRYAYVGNNPLSLTDPLGLDPNDGSHPEDGSHECWSNDGFGVQWWTTGSCAGPGNSEAGNLAFSGGFSDPFLLSYQVPAPGAQCFDGGCTAWIPVFVNISLGGDSGGGGESATNCVPGTKGCFNVPANKGTTPSTGCSVSGSCGPTANTHGMSHCSVTVNQNGKYTTYDGGPTGSIWNSTLQVQHGPGGPPGPNTFYISGSCSMAGCVPQVAQQINDANMWYSFPFQNSNTAAGMMLNQCGANVSLPVWGPQ